AQRGAAGILSTTTRLAICRRGDSAASVLQRLQWRRLHRWTRPAWTLDTDIQGDAPRGRRARRTMTMREASTEETPRFVIVGAGPAGLTAGVELVRRGVQPLILERDTLVGGIARTEDYKGFHFDMGGHRFYTKWGYMNRLWQELLGDELLLRPRLSRIYY